MRTNTKNTISVSEVGVTPSRRKSIGTDSDGLKHSTGPQLLDCSDVIELEGGLIIIGFYASDVMRFGCVQCPHQRGQRLTELRADGRFGLF